MRARKSLEPGSHLGRYELLTAIAQGGMATVWAARQTGSHGFRKTVALKTMLPMLSDDPQFERMFLAEARLAMRVQHPNVAGTLDLGEDGGLLFLVMEWVDGESLSTLMKAVESAEGRFPLRLALHICSRAARGLHAAHEVTDDDDQPVGIVHRDVSPQNLMISFDGHVKVVDFGVAKGQTENGATQAGQFKGKVPYMAPEQASGDAVDRRTDIFAMGTLLYRLTTGKHPFMGANPSATIANVATARPVPPSHHVPDYPPELAAIVSRWLAKAPEDRYASMAALADELDVLLVSFGTPVTDDELGTCARRHLGELRKQRREAMRDAARALGWAMATSDSLPRVSLPDPMSMTPSGTTGGHALSRSAGTPRVTQSGVSRARASYRRMVAAIALVAAAGAGAALAFYLAQQGRPTATASAQADAGAPVVAPSSPAPEPSASADTSTAPSAAASTTTPSAEPDREHARPAARPGPASPRPAKTGKPTTWSGGPDMGF